jgi:O-antigen/teichoic acid export membrane protein
MGIRLTVLVAMSIGYWLLATNTNLSMVRDTVPVILPLLSLFWLHSFRGLLLSLLQSEKLFAEYAAALLIAAALKPVLVLALAFMTSMTVWLVLLVENVSLLISILFVGWRKRSYLADVLRARARGAKELFAFSLPIYLHALVDIGSERASHYIVAAQGGPIAIANFSVAAQLASAGRRAFDAFANVYLPTQTSNFANSDAEAAKDLANRSMLWITFIFATGIGTFAVIRTEVVMILFTARYVGVADMMVFFMVALVFRSLQVLMGYFSVAAGYNYFPIRISAVSSVFNISLTWLLIHQYGYQGAVIAIVVTQALIGVAYYISLLGVGYHLAVGPVVVVLAYFAGMLAWVLHTDSLFLAALAVPAFLSASVITLPTLRNDLMMVVDWLRKKNFLTHM